MLALFVPAADARDVSAARRTGAGWERHYVREFGMNFDFPTNVFSLASAETRPSGVVYFTPDRRAKIGMFGFVNDTNEKPAGLLNRVADFRAAKFTYIRTTPRFFVASGTRDGMIFYRRCNFSPRGDRRVGCVYLDYPQQEKRVWDGIVTRMSLSLRVAPRE
jgi:hypothetical protein